MTAPLGQTVSLALKLNRLGAALVLGILTGCTALPSAEEVQVLGVLVAEVRTRFPPGQVVRLGKIAGCLAGWPSESELLAGLEPLVSSSIPRRELVAAYVKANATPAIVPPWVIPEGYEIVSPTSLVQRLADRVAGAESAPAYNSSTYSLSRVGFDRGHTIALVCAGNGVGGGCVLFAKGPDGWKPRADLLPWAA
jgi:hypothetical protein